MAFSTQALAEEIGVLYRYGGRGATTFWLPCESRGNVDISFSYFSKSLIRTLFRLPEHVEIVPGLYCYGRGAASAARAIRSDEQLVSALEKIVRCAACVHWTASELSASDQAGSIACIPGNHTCAFLSRAQFDDYRVLPLSRFRNPHGTPTTFLAGAMQAILPLAMCRFTLRLAKTKP